MNSLPLLANLPDILSGGTGSLLAVIIVLALMACLTILGLLVKYYRRCPSNRLLVVYGKTKRGAAATCIHGGARLVYPLIQDYAWLNLEPMQIEIPLCAALSAENIRVNVPSVFTVGIGTTEELMQNAAIRLLDLTSSEIEKQASEIIFGQLRQVIASMQIEQINRDRDAFLTHIQNSVEPELRKIGLVLINVNITDITDESGYIEAIGKKAATEAVQKARGDVADNEKMGAIRVAEAEREKAIQVADAGARAVEGENIAKADIAASQATLQVKQAEAYQLGETEKVTAEAAVLEAEHLASE
jgi:flotillin